MNKINLILNTDSYKLSHYLQYSNNAKYISAYIESRGGRWNRVLFYGLQMFLKEYLTQKITHEDIDEAKEVVKAHQMPFNEEDWRYIVDTYDGKLPLEIEAVAEGSIVQTENVLVQIKNTDPRLAWLVGYIETSLLRGIWYPAAVATNSYFCKQTILSFLRETGSPENIGYALHDFGARGVSSFESAGIGSSAHLINFKGTDTITGILFAKKYYGIDMAATSIPASEHSTIISWGKNGEFEAFENMVNKFGNQNFACVIDSYDTLAAISKWGENKDENNKTLFDRVFEMGGKIVLRPDSGNPVVMACECIEKMMEIAGFTINEKGYKVLPDHIRLIYGDGINPQSINDILSELKFRQLSADNISFGMGGALLQHINRDTLRFAMKINAISQDGQNWVPVSKNPITDPSKRSRHGRLALIKQGSSYKTIPFSELGNFQNKLIPVFRNGEILKETNFYQIRTNALES